MAMLKSSLFTIASKAARQAASREFSKSDLGKLMGEVSRLTRRPNSQKELAGVLRRYSRLDPAQTLRQLMGGNFGGLVNEVQRYAKAGTTASQLVGDFLQALGPVGKLIQSLIKPGEGGNVRRDIQAAIDLIRAFGGEVLPGQRFATLEDVARGLRAARERLESYGFQTVGTEGPMRRVVTPEGRRKTVDVEMHAPIEGKEKWGRVDPSHPMLTGEMVRTPASTNVYEFGYDIDILGLYVRFQTKHDKGTRGGPGPLYLYRGVTPQEFMGLYRVKDLGGGTGPGVWVWDVLRVRGTVSGHQKDYALVGIMGNYVPRKATIRPTYRTTNKRTGRPLKRPIKTGTEEWYQQRTVRTHEGRLVRSVLRAERVARPIGPRGPGR